jgi:hypothetical protein
MRKKRDESLGATMASVADIQADLPGWPGDVVEQWLHYFANEPDCGWPPPEPFGNSRWKALLGGRPLTWWKNVTWKQEKMKCDLPSLSPKARAGVNDILAEMRKKHPDAVTKRRFSHAYIHIMDNGVFPRALVTMKIPGGVSLLEATPHHSRNRTTQLALREFGRSVAE